MDKLIFLEKVAFYKKKAMKHHSLSPEGLPVAGASIRLVLVTVQDAATQHLPSALVYIGLFTRVLASIACDCAREAPGKYARMLAEAINPSATIILAMMFFWWLLIAICSSCMLYMILPVPLLLTSYQLLGFVGRSGLTARVLSSIVV